MRILGIAIVAILLAGAPARADPNAATAWFNLCATAYNTGDTEAALKACDRAIAADPGKADAWFIKGSVLFGQAPLDKAGRMAAPPGTRQALQKYLEIAPNGAHAGDVKAMLDFLATPQK
jgi:tetratricopeptide (TPR) repeat protein